MFYFLELSNPCLYKETEFLKRLGEDASQETSKYDEDNEDTLPSKAEVCKWDTKTKFTYNRIHERMPLR